MREQTKSLNPWTPKSVSTRLDKAASLFSIGINKGHSRKKKRAPTDPFFSKCFYQSLKTTPQFLKEKRRTIGFLNPPSPRLTNLLAPHCWSGPAASCHTGRVASTASCLAPRPASHRCGKPLLHLASPVAAPHLVHAVGETERNKKRKKKGDICLPLTCESHSHL